MLKFSARYARKVKYCNIARGARRKNCNFVLLLPHQSKTWIDAPDGNYTNKRVMVPNYKNKNTSYLFIAPICY